MAAKLFISYAHADEKCKDQLLTHLTMLKRDGLIEPWHDRMIMAGQAFSAAIDNELEKAEIVLLLVSANFLDSAYCYSREMKKALERHDAGAAHVVPVIVRPCDWRNSALAELNAVPRDGKPIILWTSDDEAYLDVANAVRRIAMGLKQRSRAEGRKGATQSDSPPDRTSQPSSRSLRVLLAGVVMACVAGVAAYWQPWQRDAPLAAPTSAAQVTRDESSPSGPRKNAGAETARGDEMQPRGAAATSSVPAATLLDADAGSIALYEGALVIAEIAATAPGGEAWDPGTKALSQLPDVLLCFRQSRRGRETCRPTSQEDGNTRSKAQGNTSHVADTYADMKAWNAMFWLELKNQDWREARTMGSAECHFGKPCAIPSASDGKSIVAEVIVLPALASAGEVRLRYLQPCVDPASLLARQVRALLAASGHVPEPKQVFPPISYDLLARTYLAAAGRELPPVLVDVALESARGKRKLASVTDTFRGTLLQAAVAATDWSSAERDEIQRAVGLLRRDLTKAGIVRLLDAGCG